MAKYIEVKLNEEQPESTEIIAASIIKISDGFSFGHGLFSNIKE